MMILAMIFHSRASTMIKQIKTLILTTLLAIAPLSVHAQQVDKTTVEKLLEATNAKSMIDLIHAQMQKQFSQWPKQLGVKEDEQAIVEKYLLEINDMIKAEFNWQRIQPQIIDIYTANFTQTEIEDILAFYQTDSGRSLLTKMPAVTQSSMQLSNDMLVSALPKIENISKKLQAELTAHRQRQQ